MSNDQIDSDEERDIADDPLLAALDADLRAASRKGDNRLVLFIGIALLLALLSKLVRIPTWSIDVLASLSALSILGGIAYTVGSVVQKKLVVADRYGLRCRACGRRPKVFRILQAAELRKCPWCRSALDVYLPSKRGRG
ncbi:MAG: hypothetical protein PVH25_15170 [Burkholderiales bacterium]|jgi:hypothetical protein